jgi:hypothetical protein
MDATGRALLSSAGTLDAECGHCIGSEVWSDAAQQWEVVGDRVAHAYRREITLDAARLDLDAYR